MDFYRRPRNVRAINLTPLIDVVFQLIVFFMVSTSFVMSESMELSLPSSSKAKEKIAQKDGNTVLKLLVQPDVRVKASGKLYTLDELDRVITKVLDKNPEQRIMILSSDHVSVQQLVAVMDLVNLDGGKYVHIDHAGRNDVGFDMQIEDYNPKVKVR